MEFLANLHPKIVHFPVALLVAYSFLEILGILIKKESISQTAYVLLLLGVIGAIAAVLTGNQADEVAKMWFGRFKFNTAGLISLHETYATISLFIFTGILALRTYLIIKKKFNTKIKYLFIFLAIIGFYFIIETGMIGGELVYKRGVGVEILRPH
jgi:uncharacterized membrane protein